MGVRRRRHFSREFKVEAVRQLEAGVPPQELARQLAVHPSQLHRWRAQVEVDAATAFPGNGRRRTAEDEVVRLRKELELVRAERDFLKKTAVFFARESP